MFRTSIVISLCISIGVGQHVYNKRSKRQMSFIGLALEAFNPCPDSFIFMEREIGRRPSEENYWKGSVNLDKYKNIPEARIELQLDTPAILTIDPEIARVYSEGTLFRITPFDVKDRITFEVKAQQDKPFPNIVAVKLNERPVCVNPQKIEPTILGSKPQAIGTVTSSPIDFIPFCGRRQLEHSELIIQGKPTSPGDWPWHIALYSYNRQKTISSYKCGGTLISTRAVVTASHCVTKNGEKLSSDLLVVHAGKYNLKIRDVGSQEREVLEIYVHPEFDITTLRNDIAMLRLLTEIKFNEYIQPICLWSATNTEKADIFRKEGIVVGWGLNENETLSNELRAGNQTIIADIDCIYTYPNFFSKYLHEKTLCAGNGPRGGASACNGDSGGGLVIPMIQPDNKISYFLRGIVSVSVTRENRNLCNPKFYVIYTDAAKYLDWINQYK